MEALTLIKFSASDPPDGIIFGSGDRYDNLFVIRDNRVNAYIRIEDLPSIFPYAAVCDPDTGSRTSTSSPVSNTIIHASKKEYRIIEGGEFVYWTSPAWTSVYFEECIAKYNAANPLKPPKPVEKASRWSKIEL